MIKNKDCYNRIFNRKFRQAVKYMKDESEETKAIIEALAHMWGNIGWEDVDGDMSVMLDVACDHLLICGDITKDMIDEYYGNQPSKKEEKT